MSVLFRFFGKGAAHMAVLRIVLESGTVVWSIEEVLDLDRILYFSSRRAATSDSSRLFLSFMAR